MSRSNVVDLNHSSSSEMDEFKTSHEYERAGLPISVLKFLEVTDLLLENPNLNSSHLFRADILYDSEGTLKTKTQKERACDGCDHLIDPEDRHVHEQQPAPKFKGRTPDRTVIRRLIPRNTNIDKTLDQRCYLYDLSDDEKAVVYYPQVVSSRDMPWYHPPVRALAYVFALTASDDDCSGKNFSKLTVQYLPFPDTPEPIPERLHRTLLSLLNTFIRLAKQNDKVGASDDSAGPVKTCSSLAASLKDTIIPQHLVQDTYAELKHRYAADLIARWTEQTEPSKHVFEDLAIAAFLIELWKLMYRSQSFPGFVDIACGNGVLVYILIREGYQGHGFDARKRKTWAILGIDEYLRESICVPKPFLDVSESLPEGALGLLDIHDGIFSQDTFVISNHADELTLWTPLLAALSSPLKPLPFLAIPCCSHALSGAKHRYTPKDAQTPSTIDATEDQPVSGDLKALRSAKTRAANHQDDKSQYACLTRKVVAIAKELNMNTQLTMMRIPSTRNIGLVGNGRPRPQLEPVMRELSLSEADAHASALTRISNIVDRECSKSGGLQSSAQTWITRALKLQQGQGRGKVNLGFKPEKS